MAETCPLCSGMTCLLPVPHPRQALISDGRLWQGPLQKKTCLECGCVSHVAPPAADFLSCIYSPDYGLQHTGGVSGAARDDVYAQYLASKLPAPKSVLEVGCGTGKLLRALAAYWQGSKLIGIDPALSEDGNVTGEKVVLVRTTWEHYAEEYARGAKYDLLLSVNAIEHLPVVDAFFSTATRMISDGGRLALICPAAYPPNQELLFHDHIHTFTASALSVIARRYGFFLQSSATRLPTGDFQLAVFVRQPGEEFDSTLLETDFEALAQSRTHYLKAWARLDDVLVRRTQGGKSLAIFGAGQMAALLRAYVPSIWQRVDLLMVDDLTDAWKFEKPVLEYAQCADKCDEIQIVVATTPAVQERVARRLSRDGFSPVRFDDVIVA